MTPKSLAESIDFNLAPTIETLGFCGSLLRVCLVRVREVWFCLGL